MAFVPRTGIEPAPAPRASPVVDGDSAPLLELIGIEKSFDSIQALRGACLSAAEGEIVGLCGESGAGKSTLVKILAGVIPHGAYVGQVVIDGKEQKLASPSDARRAGVAVVHQKGMLVPQLTVAENLMLGHEPRRFGLVDEARLESEARAHLENFGIAQEVGPRATVSELGAGLKQMLEIVRALAHGARILVLDEPAATLLPHERAKLFAWLSTLKRNRTTCVYATQRMDDVIGLCDRVTVLRDGRTAQTIDQAPLARPTVRGRYLVCEEIASGGMAVVYLGKMLGPFGFTTTVAIKRLHRFFAKDPEFVAMFLDEARLASRVRHPNVVPVLDVFAEGGELNLVMEFVEGISLAQLWRLSVAVGTPIPLPVAVAIVSSVLQGLHAAHEARDEQGELLGLVHRDVSPQNVLVGRDGVARLIDFGVAKAAGRSSVSRDGQLKGKIAYMAPEQLRRGVVNARTDIYGASVLLWELLTGDRLFDGETEGTIVGRVLDDLVPDPSTLRTGLPLPIDRITSRGLERDQARRFESAREMARELETAVRPATAGEISEWVHSLAEPALVAQREKVSRLEQASASRDQSNVITIAATAVVAAPERTNERPKKPRRRILLAAAGAIVVMAGTLGYWQWATSGK